MFCPPRSSLTAWRRHLLTTSVCCNSPRHVADPEPLLRREAAHSGGAALGRPTLHCYHFSFLKACIISPTNSLKLTDVPGETSPSVLTGMQFKTLCIVQEECSLHSNRASCLRHMLLTVKSAAKKNSCFPFSAIWHRDCIDLLVDLARGITWCACGDSVNEDSSPCAQPHL